MALDFVKSRVAIKEELDLVFVEVHLRNIAPGSLANSELLHHILNELQVPVITMCAHHDEEALSEHVALGACSHVLKPLDTASLNMLKQKALEHKSKKATPQVPIPNRTKSRMVSSSTERLQEMLILEENNLSNTGNSEFEVPEVEKAHGCSKKLGRVTWTVELHEKFLDAIEVLGDKYATPERSRRLMNVKGLTWKHIGSHLQKHRSRKQNAKQGGQHQRNASTKLVSELIGSGQTAATTESITPRVDADIREAYPSRMWKQVKEAAALKTYMYTRTSGISIDSTKSVWDEYQKGLQKEFSASNKRWQHIGLSSSKCQLPVKNNVVVIDGGVSSEAPKAAGEIGYGASVESSCSSSLSTCLVDQVGDNNHSEAAGKYDNVGNINLLEGTMNKDASDPLAFLLSDDLDLIGPSDGLEEQVSYLMSELEGS
ncbi:hypothetical protein C2845_PM09G23470 [Panicum miliaceum]|uniref:Response regulatory domain-containing protein n=1 Tax=Panicum miliaceum TaxID=4540 RepID=A0A3L6RY98_PANMI|nr:hypothetical protein C2845_PM09G23470 [Panicum miliaceum]